MAFENPKPFLCLVQSAILVVAVVFVTGPAKDPVVVDKRQVNSRIVDHTIFDFIPGSLQSLEICIFQVNFGVLSEAGPIQKQCRDLGALQVQFTVENSTFIAHDVLKPDKAEESIILEMSLREVSSVAESCSEVASRRIERRKEDRRNSGRTWPGH